MGFLSKNIEISLDENRHFPSLPLVSSFTFIDERSTSGREGSVDELETFSALNPNIKIQILICYPYTFSIEVVRRICW